MKLHSWAARWGIPLAAIAELQEVYGLNGTTGDTVGKSEAYAQSRIVLEAAHKGVRLWRNNVGVLEDRNGRPVRYGLMNESSAMNAVLKSPDLVGIRPVRIEQQHVGLVIGQFCAREAKEPGWHYSETEHELAQLRALELINAMGGDACFATGEGTI